MQEAQVRDHSTAGGRGGEAVVIARDVTKQYGGLNAVEELSLDVPPQSIFGFIGPSGSGKTTTIRLLTGVARPTAGEVFVLGQPPSTFTPAERARVGYLPQLSVLFPTMSLRENLQFVASLYGMPLRRAAKLREVLELVELWDHRSKRLRDASGGMQRRLALAAALVHDPDLVFLDEPTAGIDPVLRKKLWERFRELREEGRTLFVTTQYVGEAEYCDFVAVVAEGRILAADTPEGLRRRAFGGALLEVRTGQPLSEPVLAELRDLPEVSQAPQASSDGLAVRLVVDDAARAIPRVTELLDRHGIVADAVQEERPPFDDVFVRLVEDGAA
jgi:ABC-2 type transport system ATP-binding protein